MSNMSYCRFENTARDLCDCAEHIQDNLTGDYEPRAKAEAYPPLPANLE